MYSTLYEEKNLKDVTNLFELVYNKKVKAEFWKWRLEKFGNPIRILFWEKEKLIGHYYLHPIKTKIDNHEELCLQSMSIAIHPDFQGKGIVLFMAKEAYSEARKQNYKFLFGYPNQKSFKIHQHLGWTIEKIPEFSKNISKKKYEKHQEFQINEITKVDERIDKIWNFSNKSFQYMIKRDKETLNWRYIQQPVNVFSNSPDYFYKMYLVEKEDTPIAYFVLKIFGTEKCHIVDFFGELNEDIFKSITNFAEKIAYSLNLKQITFWTNRKELEKISINLGFYKNESEAYWGCLRLDEKFDKQIEDKNNWFITMNDSDIF